MSHLKHIGPHSSGVSRTCVQHTVLRDVVCRFTVDGPHGLSYIRFNHNSCGVLSVYSDRHGWTPLMHDGRIPKIMAGLACMELSDFLGKFTGWLLHA